MRIFAPYNTYSAHIFKFWVNQITMSALGLLVAFAVNLTDGIILLQIVLASFPIGFMCFLVYDYMFQFGQKDSVSIQAGRIDFDKLFGLKIYAYAYAPTFLFILLTLIFTVCGVADVPAITAVLYYLLNAYNLGFFWIIGSALPQYVTMLIMMIPVGVATFLGYYLGAKDKPILKMLGINIKRTK